MHRKERAIAAFANYYLCYGGGGGAQDPAKFPEAFYYLLGKGFPVFSRIVGRHLVAVQLGGAPSSFVLHLYMSRESDRLESYFTYSLHT